MPGSANKRADRKTSNDPFLDQLCTTPPTRFRRLSGSSTHTEYLAALLECKRCVTMAHTGAVRYVFNSLVCPHRQLRCVAVRWIDIVRAR